MISGIQHFAAPDDELPYAIVLDELVVEVVPQARDEFVCGGMLRPPAPQPGRQGVRWRKDLSRWRVTLGTSGSWRRDDPRSGWRMRHYGIILPAQSGQLDDGEQFTFRSGLEHHPCVVHTDSEPLDQAT